MRYYPDRRTQTTNLGFVQFIPSIVLGWIVKEKGEDIAHWVERRINRVVDAIQEKNAKTLVKAWLRGPILGVQYLAAGDSVRDFMDIQAAVAGIYASATVVVPALLEKAKPLIEEQLAQRAESAIAQGLAPEQVGMDSVDAALKQLQGTGFEPEEPKKSNTMLYAGVAAAAFLMLVSHK